jgi:SH3-like domain-containing protein
MPSVRSVPSPDISVLLRAVLFVILLLIPTLVAAAEGPSGLPLPRFATTRSTPINVRVGPGTKYDVAWVYVKAGTPVEIVQEFDTWRKIRDFDGSEGWVHQNLLSGKRAGLAAPWRNGEQIPLLAGRNPDGGVRAYLGPGFRVEISGCDGAWCEVSATARQDGGNTYSGYLPQTELWGVYEGEKFD